MFLFDTDTLSEIMKRDPSPSLLRRLDATPRERQFTSAVTIGEMVFGAERSPRRDLLIMQLHHLVLPHVSVLSFDQETAEIYGKLRADLELAGTPLDIPDLQIAAVAIQHRLIVVTGNVRHFGRIKQLAVQDWIRGD
jgi:tRNA(fMet)-specific endonuclease VapC